MRNNMTPMIRFEGFTDAWEQRKLGDLSEISRGASPRPIQDPKWFDKDSDIGWLRIADVTEQNGRITHLEQKISKLAEEKTRVLLTPHLLLSIAATVGKPVINYVKTGVHDGFLIFYKPQFDQEFMFQWLEMFRSKWQKYGQPGSQVNLNSELVKNQDILLPDMDEQIKISAFFKSLDDTIALQERKLNLLREQKKGYLQKMFPKQNEKFPELRFEGFTDAWEQCKLGDVGSVAMNKRIFKNETSEYGEIPFYKIGTFGREPDSFISRKLFEEYKSKYSYPEKGDLLISASGSIGKIVEYQGKDEYFQDSNIVWLKHDKRLVNSFLRQFYNIVKWQGLEGSTIKRLYNKNILQTDISITSVEEQTKIGNFFKQLDDTITLQEEKLDKMKEMKKGFLQKMFV